MLGRIKGNRAAAQQPWFQKQEVFRQTWVNVHPERWTSLVAKRVKYSCPESNGFQRSQCLSNTETSIPQKRASSTSSTSSAFAWVSSKASWVAAMSWHAKLFASSNSTIQKFCIPGEFRNSTKTIQSNHSPTIIRIIESALVGTCQWNKVVPQDWMSTCSVLSFHKVLVSIAGNLESEPNKYTPARDTLNLSTDLAISGGLKTGV